MPGGGGGEKTEKATPKRKQDERKKGNVFTSKEIGPLVGLLAVLYSIQFLGSYILSAIVKAFNMFWGDAATLERITMAEVRVIYIEALGVLAVAALPVLLIAGLVAVVITLAQTRGLFTMDALKPKFSKLNPINGIKNMFSLKGLVELFKSILKIIILGYVIYNQYLERFQDLPRLMEMDFLNVMAYAADFLMDIVTSVAAIYIFLVAADYLYQRWQFERDMRMTKQEIKEEYKQTEGDPQIKGKIKQRQREMSMSRMMQSVPEADVVIRNPTHYAVAIRYDAKKNHSPEVLAKGADLVALRIIKLAEETGVAVTENRPLAKSLYDTVPLNCEIPGEYFQVVAEILAYVYSKDKKKAAAMM